MPLHSPPRPARSNLVWIVGMAAGIVVGGVVAYGLTSPGTVAAAPSER